MSDNGTPTTDSLSTVYAEALYELATERGELDTIAYEAAELARLLEADHGLRRLFASRIIGGADRRGIIERLFADRYNDVLYRFVQVVNQKNRLDVLGRILAAFAALLDEKRGIVKVDAHVAAPLDEAAADRVTDALGASLGGKQIVLRQHLDPELIGGLKIQVGDELIDGSVANQLKRIRSQLVEAGHEKARALTAIKGE